MRIALIGGHGKVALQLIPLLHDADHSVDAVIRNPAHRADVEQAGAAAAIADVETMTTGELADLQAGNDMVIWCAGAGGGSAERTSAVDRDAAIRSIDAAAQAGVRQYLMLSYFGARTDHGVPPDNAFFAYAEAKAAADAHLRESGLQWTIIAPSRLTDDEPTGRIDVNGPGSPLAPDAVPRGDVAAVIAAVVQRGDLAGRMIEFNTGQTPIDQALNLH